MIVVLSRLSSTPRTRQVTIVHLGEWGQLCRWIGQRRRLSTDRNNRDREQERRECHLQHREPFIGYGNLEEEREKQGYLLGVCWVTCIVQRAPSQTPLRVRLD